MKHPSVRLASSQDFLPETWDIIRSLTQTFVSALQAARMPVIDVANDGSYPRGLAQFHSDFDVNLETSSELNRLLVIRTIKNNGQAFVKIAEPYRRGLFNALGLVIRGFKVQPPIAEMNTRACYRILEGRWYHKDSITKMVWNTKNLRDEPEILPQNARRPRRYLFGSIDPDTGDSVAWRDPYETILPEWRNKLNGKMLEIGETPDTVYLKNFQPYLDYRTRL